MHEWHLPNRIVRIDRRPLVMGIVNVTPDSFSDGGLHASTDAAVAHGLKLVAEGADLLDIGGESTRPGAVPVPLEEELRRVVSVVKALAAQSGVPISVDTYKAVVARACLELGAQIVNDVTALQGDPLMAGVARDFRAGVILMHMQGTPQTMQLDPCYDNVVEDVGRFFEERLRVVAEIGIAVERVVLDPGIGFGKKSAHNLELLARLDEFQRFARPVCLGVSRKGLLGRLLGRTVEHRLPGSLACVCHAACRKAAQIVRVHDVKATRDALEMIAAIEAAGGPI